MSILVGVSRAIYYTSLLVLLVKSFKAYSEERRLSECGVTVKTLQGDVKGRCINTIKGRSVHSFHGIPYAEAPLNELRFKEPQPSAPWTGIKELIEEAPICLQYDKYMHPDGVIGQEDCLYLNIYTPSLLPTANLPVIVWIHGGAFIIGSGSTDVYGPKMLLDENVILVTLNYRIGFFGFASLEDDVLPGNNGLKDQLLALHWIKDNIINFGGNPDAITIAGESSGAASVHLHMLSPLSKGLFHRAILSSGSADCPWAIWRSGVMKKNTKKMGNIVKCTQDSSEEFMDCLRTVPGEKLVFALGEFSTRKGFHPMIIFAPVFESESKSNSFITRQSYLTKPTIPMIIGANTHEGTYKLSGFFTSSKDLAKLQEFQDNYSTLAPEMMFYRASATDNNVVSKRIKDYYFNKKKIDYTTADQFVKMISNAWFVQGSLAALKRHAGPAYAYIFSYSGDYSITTTMTRSNFRYGVSHLDDLIYLFPLENFIQRNIWGFSDRDAMVSEIMVKIYTNFAKHGTPTVNNKPFQWDTVNFSKTNYVEIDGSCYPQKNGYFSEDASFWNSLPWRTNLLN